VIAEEGDATRRDRRGHGDDPLCAIWSGALTSDHRRKEGTSSMLTALASNTPTPSPNPAIDNLLRRSARTRSPPLHQESSRYHSADGELRAVRHADP
jgi:hypothetical protein